MMEQAYTAVQSATSEARSNPKKEATLSKTEALTADLGTTKEAEILESPEV